MADRFGCDLVAVENTAKQLATVEDEMRNFGRRGDEYESYLRSHTIQRAIRKFEDDSSDHRDKVVKVVEALKQRMDGLIQGCREVDNALSGGLDEMDKSLAAFAQPPPAVLVPTSVAPPPPASTSPDTGVGAAASAAPAPTPASTGGAVGNPGGTQ